MTKIDELHDRLTKPNASFTREEVNALIDWEIDRALKDQYHQAVIATQMQQAVTTTESVKTSMARLLTMYNPSITPTLEVIQLEQD